MSVRGRLKTFAVTGFLFAGLEMRRSKYRCWVLAFWSVSVRERLYTFFDAGFLLAGLGVRESKYRLLMWSPCLLVCGCEGAALNLFCCWLLACWPAHEREYIQASDVGCLLAGL